MRHKCLIQNCSIDGDTYVICYELNDCSLKYLHYLLGLLIIYENYEDYYQDYFKIQ